MYLCVCAHRCDLLMMGGEQSYERTTEEGEEESEKHQICSDTESSGSAVPEGKHSHSVLESNLIYYTSGQEQYPAARAKCSSHEEGGVNTVNILFLHKCGLFANKSLD